VENGYPQEKGMKEEEIELKKEERRKGGFGTSREGGGR